MLTGSKTKEVFATACPQPVLKFIKCILIHAKKS